MTSIDVVDMTITSKNTKKHCGVLSHFGVFTQKIIDVIEYTLRMRAHCHSGKGALQHSREQRRAQPFAGNVRDQEGRAVFAHRENVEVIAADRKARNIRSAYREMWKISEAAGQKRLLDITRDAD